MPPLLLTNLLQTTLPHLSGNGRATLSALGSVNGRPPASSELAHWLGFHDRYQFARALRREGLPPLETLAGWTRTLYWLLESERLGATLRTLAERDGVDPAVAYRLIRRVTGRRWSEIRREGLAVTLLRFRDRCGNGHGAAPLRPRTVGMAPAGRRTTAGAPSLHAAFESLQRHRSPRLRGVQGDRVPVGGAPFDVAMTATGTALVARGHAAAVDVIAFAPSRLAQTIHVGPVPTRVVPNFRGDLAYVTSQFSEAIDVIDLNQGRQTRTFHIDGHPLGAVLSGDDQTLYVSTNRDRIVALALPRGSVVADLPLPHGSPQLCMHPSRRRLYAAGFRTGVIAEVEVPTLRRARTFEVGGIVQEVAVTADGQTLYASNEAGWLDVIHLPSGKRTARSHFRSAAFGLAITADQADILLGLLYAGEVLILERDTLAVRAVLRTGGKPRLMAAQSHGPVLVANEAGWVDIIR